MNISVFRSLFILLFIIGTTGACSQESAEPEDKSNLIAPTGKTFVYSCSEDSSVVAKVNGSDAWFMLEDTTVHMPQVRSASGTRFTSGGYLYWSKGDEAIIEIANRSYGHCVMDREEATWQDAMLRGVDFRATGFEPGWYLEIYPDSIQYVLDYGERTLTSPRPEPTVDPENGDTIYDINTELHDITIRVTEESCTSPSGRQFTSTTYLTVDENEYRGCGRSLQ